MGELNRPQLSVSRCISPPLIKPDGRISRVRLSEDPSSVGLRLGMFPCGPGGQFPESMSLIQQLIGVMLVLSFGTFVFAPEPAPQPAADKTLHFLQGSCAVAVVKISAPAFEFSVNRADRFFR